MGVPRVVILSPAYPPLRGGSATYFQTLIRSLTGKVSFTVLSLEAEGSSRTEELDGANVRRVLPDRRGGGAIPRYITVIPAVISALNKERKKGPFIIHAHSNGIYGYSASLFSSFFGIPMIKEVQDTSDKAFVLKAGKVHRWIATGKFVRRRLTSFGIPEERIVTFPSINPPELSELASKAMKGRVEHPGKVRFVYFGWLMNRVKGVDVLLKAFSLASKELDGLELWIIGDGPDRKGLEELANGLPVRFLGSLPYTDLVKTLAQSDIVVLASHEEANPRCIIEGYALGLPAIATDVGGVIEELLDGKTGILVKDNDVEALSRAMVKLASDQDLKEILGNEGKEFLERLPTWSDLSDALYKEYLILWDHIMN
ncbi:MAG: glycosyltransferase family 4 protein [Candidatus Thermoplasmatota archaeon]|jgi:glycosyltransferase involved in cell wall biosynthesis|nr:glycosyltransferase family 4 protein [Candidatus Thermoplasmatota archaeon]